MVHKGVLSKRDGELQVFLLDHAMLFTKLAKGKQQEQYKVYRRVSLQFMLIRQVRLTDTSLAYTSRTSLNYRRRRSHRIDTQPTAEKSGPRGGYAQRCVCGHHQA
jgi:hypothetical protein